MTSRFLEHYLINRIEEAIRIYFQENPISEINPLNLDFYFMMREEWEPNFSIELFNNPKNMYQLEEHFNQVFKYLNKNRQSPIRFRIFPQRLTYWHWELTHPQPILNFTIQVQEPARLSRWQKFLSYCFICNPITLYL